MAIVFSSPEDRLTRQVKLGVHVNDMRGVLAFQGLYYVLTGVWPLISLRTFEAVTGPKTDDWLVQTVGVLAAVIGAALLVGSKREPPHLETLTLSVLSAVGFIAVDVVFVLRGTISSIYLVDAAAQAVLLGVLLVLLLTKHRSEVQSVKGAGRTN